MTERRDIGSRLENWARLFQRVRAAGHLDDRRHFDQADAELLERVMPALPTPQRSLLWSCYVKQETPEEVCWRIGIERRPATQFVDAFRAAQNTVEALAARTTSPQDH